MEPPASESTPGRRRFERSQRSLQLFAPGSECHGALEGAPGRGSIAQTELSRAQRRPGARPGLVAARGFGEVGGGAAAIPLLDPRAAAEEPQRNVRRHPRDRRIEQRTGAVDPAALAPGGSARDHQLVTRRQAAEERLHQQAIRARDVAIRLEEQIREIPPRRSIARLLPTLVDVIRSCRRPISSASVGW